MAHKSQWIIDHEKTLEDYASGDIDYSLAMAYLRGLGFTESEASEQLEDMNRGQTAFGQLLSQALIEARYRASL